MKKKTISVVIGTVASLTLATPAFAAVCGVADKPDGAGNVGDVLIDPITHQVISAPSHSGGFVDVYLDLNQSGFIDEGDLQIEDDTFYLPANRALVREGYPAPTLPDGALHAGGEGKGVEHHHADGGH